jgi:hypothetical protein
VLGTVGEECGEFVFGHQCFFSGEVCVRILDQSLQNRVDDGCAFTGSECLVEFVDDRQETLVLTIEFGNVYAIPI